MIMFKKIVAFFVFAIALSANASTTSDITSLLKGYKWYGTLVKYEKGKGNNRHENYRLRYSIAKYLESVDLYDAGNTQYCTDVDSNHYQKKRDSCYIGTAEQNTMLLKALKEKKVKEHLEKANAYLILNGPEDMFLNHIKSLKYDWAEKMAKDMALVPKKWPVCKKRWALAHRFLNFIFFYWNVLKSNFF